MVFAFSNTSQPAFGGTQPKPTAFGAPFGVASTSASTGFNFGSTFGSSNQSNAFSAIPQPSVFGSSFGATTSAAPAFGSTFGAAPSSAPGFGSTFGTTTTAAPSFGSTFGTATTPSTGLFGAPTPKPPGLFGAPSASTASNLFSTSGSGTSSLFGSTTQTPNLFGASTSTPGLFGSSTSSTAPSLFGSSFGGTTASTGLFGSTTTGIGGGLGLFGGTTTTSAPSLFGGFGSSSTGPTGFTGFGTGTSGFGSAGTGFGTTSTGFGATGSAPSLFATSAFGAKPGTAAVQQLGAPSVDAQLQQILASFYGVNVFNDERDDILKKWNMLQACWGTGKGYYGPNQHVMYTCANPLYRFKAVGYNIVVEADNSEGIVKLVFNKKESEIRSQREVFINGISGILGNKPNLVVNIECMRAINETQTDVRISVLEKGVTGTSRKIPASDLAAFLNTPTQKQQLANVGVTLIAPYVTPTKADLEEYLNKPPKGIDVQMWEAAKIDNPNPKKYTPVAINGFTDLRNRMHNQEYETGLHKAFLQKVDNDISELRKKHAGSIAQITDHKQKFLHLQHRILRILVKQECTRKAGLTMQPEEELLRGRLETMSTHLNTPTQFKGQLNELLSCIKTVGNVGRQCNEHYKIDPQVQEDIKQFLQMQQNGISNLISIINNDLQALKIISEGLGHFTQQKPFILN